MSDSVQQQRTTLGAAERQMQAWARSAEVEERSIRMHPAHDVSQGVQAYVAISREEGTCGSEIAQELGRQLEWEVLDKNLLDGIAQHFQVSRPMLDHVDETTPNWVHNVFGTWFDRRVVTHDRYVVQLGRFVLMAARKAHVVFVGRGAQFLLPQKKGLSVRIVAPLRYRLEQFTLLEEVPMDTAQRLIKERDRGRRDFVRRHFHRDIDDPHLYDLVINVASCGIDGAVRLIRTALGQ